jgi:mRNA-degrading endonuclease RelE of RelBE toxin-antitoxin system
VKDASRYKQTNTSKGVGKGFTPSILRAVFKKSVQKDLKEFTKKITYRGHDKAAHDEEDPTLQGVIPHDQKKCSSFKGI